MKKIFILSMITFGTLMFSQSQKQFIQNLETYLNFRTIFEQTETKFDYLETLGTFSYTSHTDLPPINPKYIFDKSCNFKSDNISSIEVSGQEKGMIITIILNSKNCKSTSQKAGDFPIYQEGKDLIILLTETSRNDNDNIITLLKGAFPNTTINLK